MHSNAGISLLIEKGGRVSICKWNGHTRLRPRHAKGTATLRKQDGTLFVHTDKDRVHHAVYGRK